MDKSKSKNRRIRKKSFTEALKEKYCFNENECQSNFVIQIVFNGRPKSNETNAELGHLRNVVLSNSCVGHAGLPRDGLVTLCPNVVDLDISGNFLNSWNEIFPILSELPKLKFLNLSRNKIQDTQISCEKWQQWHDCVENLVLNDTDICWSEALTLSQCLPALKELHVCGNGYTELRMEQMKVLDSLECLRLNNNNIENWEEVWKLRHFPNLKSLILSGNPLTNVLFRLGQYHSNKANSTSDIDNPPPIQDHNGIIVELPTPQTNHNSSEEMEVKGSNNLILEISTGSISNRSVQDEKTEDANDEECERFLDGIITEACKQLEALYEMKNERITNEGKSDDDITPYDAHGGTERNQTKNNYQKYVHLCKVKNGRGSPLPGNSNSSEHQNDSGGQLFSAENHMEENNNECGDDSGIFEEDKHSNDTDVPTTGEAPFYQLQSICMTHTKIDSWQSLEALRQYPSLKSLRITDDNLWCDMAREDRRKLLIACLPNISVLNGSEVSTTDREKAERHFLRFFVNKQERPSCYEELEAKHGVLDSLVDIDIGAGFQEWATIHIVSNGRRVATDTVRVVEPVYKLRQQIARKMHKYASFKNFTMCHFACGPNHVYHPDEVPDFNELRCESLPMSRFDIMEGDEIHIDLCDNFDKWPYTNLLVTNYL
ncbi:hypothetical protein ScPMuIL_009104 [Solemya velum]